jgi:hypothetical protein
MRPIHKCLRLVCHWWKTSSIIELKCDCYKYQPDALYTCNKTFRRVRETVVSAKKQQLLHNTLCVCVCLCVCVPGRLVMWMCMHMCSLAYPACIAHVPYFVICGLSGSTKFSVLSHKLHDFRKNSLNIKCVFWFSLQRLSKTVLILRIIQRNIVINMETFPCKVLVILDGF